MPIQPPQWTEFLSCPVCYKKFNDAVELPISLGCGHTVCKACLLKLHQKKCPFDQNAISRSIEELPVNLALLQLVGVAIPEEDSVSINSISENYKFYESARRSITELASHLKCLATGSGQLNTLLSRPMQRKLVTIINCQLVEEDGRVRAMRSARSLGERTVTELILQHQNPAQLSTNLWAAIRARGCQFLGPAMQEEVLKLILLALEDGSPLSRKVLVLFVVQRLESQYPQASKTAIGHVVQLLYRASCFKVTKREEDSSLMQLKEEFRTYECLRREHDSQIVQIATEAGLRIAPEQWSSLLYGDTNHKSHMQSSIDKLQTPLSFSQSVNELVIALQRTNDQGNLARLRPHLELLANVDPSAEAPPPSWENLDAVLQAVKTVVQGLVDFLQFHSIIKPEIPQLHNTKYKTSLCRDLPQRGACPRGDNCTFAHSQDELERARGRNKKVGAKANLIIPPIANSVVLDDVTREVQTNLSIQDMRPPTDDDKEYHSENIESDQVVTVQILTAPVVSMAPSMTSVQGSISSIPSPALVPPAHLRGPGYPPPGGHIEYDVQSQQLPPIPGVPPYTPTHQPYLPENMYYTQHSVPAYSPSYTCLPEGSSNYPVLPQTMGYPQNVAPTQHPYPPQYISVYDQRYPAPRPYGETWQTSAPPYYMGQDRGFTQPLPPRYTQPYPQRIPYPQQPKSETLDDLHSRRKEILVHLNKETSPVTPLWGSTGSGQHMMGSVPNIPHTTHPLYTSPDAYILPPRQPSSFHHNNNQDQVSYELAKSVADTYATSRSTSTLAYSVDMGNVKEPDQKYHPWSSCELTETTSDPVGCNSTSNFCRDSENGKRDIMIFQRSKFQTLTSNILTKHTNPTTSMQTSKLNERHERDPGMPRSQSFSFLDGDFFIPFDPPIVSKYGPISRTARANQKSSDPVHVTAENECLLVTPVTAVNPTARPYPSSVQTPSRFSIDGMPPQLHSDTKTFSSLMGMPRMSASIVGVSVTTGEPYSLWNSESYFQNSRAMTVQDRLQHELAKVEHHIHVQENSTRELSQQEKLTCELKAIEQQISMKTGKTPNASLETSSNHRPHSHLTSIQIKPLRLGQVLDADIDLNAALTPEEQKKLKELHLSVDLNKRDIDPDDRNNLDTTTT